MFKDIGERLKIVGKVWFWIGVVLVGIMLIAGLFISLAARGGFIVVVIASILYMLIFLVAAWSSYGLDITVENSEKNKALLIENKQLLEQNNELIKQLISINKVQEE